MSPSDDPDLLGHNHSPRRSRGMLLIGATGRNSGKTEMACRIIRKWRGHTSIIAAKFTITRHCGEVFPRRAEGHSPEKAEPDDPIRMEEEKKSESGKDTGRLLMAGARHVYRIICAESQLTDAFQQFQARIPSGHPLICESNALRVIVCPDLFLMLRNREEPEVKPSAARVLELADEIIWSDGEKHDFDLERLHLRDGAWRLFP